MMKSFLLLLLVHLACGYDKIQSMKYASLSAISHCSQSSVEKWNCKQCSKVPGFMNVTYFENTEFHIVGFIGYLLPINRIVIAFRGTVDARNWAEDFDFAMISYGCKGCEIHNGFYLSYKSVQSKIRGRLQILLKAYPNAKIIATGHSLGGSLATICGIQLQNQYAKVEQIHNFGSPRVGNVNLAHFIESKVGIINRVVHHKDIVPHLPPDSVGFWHLAYEIFYDQEMNNYKVCDKSGEDRTCSNQYFPDYSFSDHGKYWVDMEC